MVRRFRSQEPRVCFPFSVRPFDITRSLGLLPNDEPDNGSASILLWSSQRASRCHSWTCWERQTAGDFGPALISLRLDTAAPPTTTTTTTPNPAFKFDFSGISGVAGVNGASAPAKPAAVSFGSAPTTTPTSTTSAPPVFSFAPPKSEFPLADFAERDARVRADFNIGVGSGTSATLVDREEISSGRLPHYGWLGTTKLAAEDGGSEKKSQVYLNTHVPFCLVAVGVQGAGKSHTLSCVIENCLLDLPKDIAGDAGMAALVLHFDQAPENMCEAVTLSRPRKDLPGMERFVKEVVILVSPANFRRRKRFYDQLGFPVKVLPLLFNWNDLDASDLQTLMAIENMPLYMESVIDYLRGMQKNDKKPTFAEFKRDIGEMDFSKGQRSPLDLRLQLLASFLIDDQSNTNIYGVGIPDVLTVLRGRDRMVVCDLTDPLFSGEQANGVFAVVLGKFVSTPAAHGRLVVCDEAHKYMTGAGTDGLSRGLVSVVRQMRHLGVRTVVSTQSPRTLPPELMELATAAVVHRFHSSDWFDVLQSRLRVPKHFADDVLALQTGEALVFTLRWGGELVPKAGEGYVKKLMIRPRLTWDGGVSKVTEGKKREVVETKVVVETNPADGATTGPKRQFNFSFN